MICLQSGGAIEGKIVELIGEYGALRVEQLQRYFSELYTGTIMLNVG